MAAQRKYPDELRERAVRMVLEKENRELRRANEILKAPPWAQSGNRRRVRRP
jgi:hypothetical protein